jgi:serine/threonine protein kinase
VIRKTFKLGHIFKETYRVESHMKGSKTAFKVSHTVLKTPFVVELAMDLSDVDDLEYEERQASKNAFVKLQEGLKNYALINHPGLSRLVDTFEEDKRHFLVREWVEGLTLRDLLEQSLKPLAQDTTLDFAGQLLALLETLAMQDPPLVLGTLCPEYIVASPEGRLSVIDYGLACHSDGKADFEPFSCPELLGGGSLDLRSDLYSLGATLFFCLTGMELPPIWDRITCQDTIATPLELNVKVSGAFWSTLERMLSLNLDQRPKSVPEVRALLEKGEFEDTPESSPGTWYPEQSDLLLADSRPFDPLAKPDWILKMIQAGVIGGARSLAVVQNREACCLDFRFAAPDVPAPRSLLEALTTDGPIESPTIAELACALRTIGEFRDFKVVLDDWKQSWSLKCRGGKLSSQSAESYGRCGVYVEVRYEGRSADRAAQSADEVIRLVRKTRLCTMPITIGKKPLEPGRGIEVTEMSKKVVQLYLVSASFPQVGKARLTTEPSEDSGDKHPFTEFAPPEGKEKFCHIDVRCFVAQGEGLIGEYLHTGYHFIRRPSRILWYRRGVLCGEQFLEKTFPLQLDIHLNGDHLQADASGLQLEKPSWLQVARLKPVLELSRILPLTRMKLTEYWEDVPGDASPKVQAFAGMAGAPLFLFFLANLVNPGFLFLKTAGVALAAKTSAVVGGATGYLTASDHVDAVRKTCIKAIDAFEKEEI